MRKVQLVKKMMAVFASVVLLVGTFTGCARKPQIDPVQVMQAVMDAELKGEVDEYVKLSGEAKEDVLKKYDELLEEFATGIAQELEAVGTTIDQAELKDLSKRMLASAKYEVQDAKKDEDDNYTVNVAVYPSDLIGKSLESTVALILEKAGNGEAIDIDPGSLVMEAYNKGLENQTYGEAEIYTVRLTHDEDYRYTPVREDLEAIGSALYTIPEELVIASGKDYGNPYLNWMKEDWEAASMEEKIKCCLAMVQKMFGFSDEEMAMVDTADPALQEGAQMMMEGIQEMYDGGFNLSVGDFTEFMMSMGMDFTQY